VRFPRITEKVLLARGVDIDHRHHIFRVFDQMRLGWQERQPIVSRGCTLYRYSDGVNHYCELFFYVHHTVFVRASLIMQGLPRIVIIERTNAIENGCRLVQGDEHALALATLL
jgi:hypothetical protein